MTSMYNDHIPVVSLNAVRIDYIPPHGKTLTKSCTRDERRLYRRIVKMLSRLLVCYPNCPHEPEMFRRILTVVWYFQQPESFLPVSREMYNALLATFVDEKTAEGILVEDDTMVKAYYPFMYCYERYAFDYAAFNKVYETYFMIKFDTIIQKHRNEPCFHGHTEGFWRHTRAGKIRPVNAYPAH